MKTLKNVFFLLLSFLLLNSCTETELLTDNELVTNPESCNNDELKTVTVPFEAVFTGDYTFRGPDETACGAPFIHRVIVDFEGTGTHLGRFTGRFDFCVAKKGYYGPADMYIVAANGDILYLTVEGKVNSGRLEDHPDHVIQYWRDEFQILGGTGRFEGATGGGYTDDYNSSLDPNSHHHWKGNITFIVGKRNP